MNITYGVNVPRPRGKERSKATVALVDFTLSDEQSMKLDFEDNDATKGAYYSIMGYIRRNGLKDQYKVVKRRTSIYVWRVQ